MGNLLGFGNVLGNFKNYLKAGESQMQNLKGIHSSKFLSADKKEEIFDLENTTFIIRIKRILERSTTQIKIT